MKLLNRITKFIFDQPVLYDKVRSLFLGGLPNAPVLKLLEATSSDQILDVGCGTGFMANETTFQKYFGIDNDPRVIEIANRRNIKNAKFLLHDLSGSFPPLDFVPTKAILYGILHHLDDAAAAGLLRKLSGMVSDRIVTLDPVYSKRHFLNNILCKLDRGTYVRTESEMLRLVSSSGLEIKEKLLCYANTKIAKYIIFRLGRKT